MPLRRLVTLVVCATLAVVATAAPNNGNATARIKDIATVEGVRINHLFGYGIVVGLNGTGDGSSPVTQSSIAAMMRTLGVPVEANALSSQSIAAVLVTAQLPPFSRPGSRIDVRISTIGDASSLQGGVLMPTELRGYDNLTHAVAQGPVSIGGINPGQGGGLGDLKLNFPTVAIIPGGAIVEGDEVPTEILQRNVVRFLLEDPDFVTANRVKDAINEHMAVVTDNRPVATALNAGVVEVDVLPLVDAFDSLVALIAEIEQLPVYTDEVARIVINERTGTVVVGHNVRISKAAVSHHDFIISFSEVEETVEYQDPVTGAPIAPTETTITTTTDVREQDGPPFRVVDESTTVQDLIDTLNALEVQPRDMIAILQALRTAGALKAELIVI